MSLIKVFSGVNKSFFNEAVPVSLFFLFIWCLYIYKTDVYYESTITLYPAGELYETYDSIFQQYETMSETLGLNINSKSNYYIPDIINSYSLKKKIVLKTWKSDKFKENVNLINYWDINNNSFLKRFIN